nr:MAG TPA: hypothetical protein [Caudoviricetes sp.]DAQ65259.1 MAG TPA: hypothetical protein [Caudoviricetes sp.]
MLHDTGSGKFLFHNLIFFELFGHKKRRACPVVQILPVGSYIPLKHIDGGTRRIRLSCVE